MPVSERLTLVLKRFVTRLSISNCFIIYISLTEGVGKGLSVGENKFKDYHQICLLLVYVNIRSSRPLVRSFSKYSLFCGTCLNVNIGIVAICCSISSHLPLLQ